MIQFFSTHTHSTPLHSPRLGKKKNLVALSINSLNERVRQKKREDFYFTALFETQHLSPHPHHTYIYILCLPSSCHLFCFFYPSPVTVQPPKLCFDSKKTLSHQIDHTLSTHSQKTLSNSLQTPNLTICISSIGENHHQKRHPPHSVPYSHNLNRTIK